MISIRVDTSAGKISKTFFVVGMMLIPFFTVLVSPMEDHGPKISF
jgi:hypothetical protein